MRKSFLVGVCLSVALSSAAVAEGAFVGVEGDYAKRLGLGIKAGYDFDIARVYAGYEYKFKAKDKDESDIFEYTQHNLTINADFTPEITNNFKAVLGGYIGYGLINGYEYEEDNKDDKEKLKGKGLVYGARLGGIYEINNNNNIEFGAKAVVDYKFKVGPYLGYTYKF